MCVCVGRGIQRQETPQAQSSQGVCGKGLMLKKEKQIGTPLMPKSHNHCPAWDTLKLIVNSVI